MIYLTVCGMVQFGSIELVAEFGGFESLRLSLDAS